VTSRQAVYLGDHTALTRTAFGAKIYLDTRDLSLAPHILLDGEWEPWITTLLGGLLAPGMTFVDVGANVGFFTLFAADRVGPEGRVWAFEPNPRLTDLIGKSLSVNGFVQRVELVKAAAMAEPGRLAFQRFAGHQGSSGFDIPEGLAEQFHDTIEEIEVDCTTLDDVLAGKGLRIDLLKIDAEGAEPSVLAGATKLLEEQRSMQILMEYTPPNRPAVETLIAHGFHMARVSEDASLEVVQTFELDRPGHVDMLFFFRDLASALQRAAAA
jgi:FkbM family methyltransferase